MAPAPPRTARAAIIEGIVLNVLAILNQCLLLREEPGTSIRPMHVTFGIFLIVIGMVFCVLPAALPLLWIKERRRTGIIAVLLAVSPLLLSIVLMPFILHVRHLTLKP